MYADRCRIAAPHFNILGTTRTRAPRQRRIILAPLLKLVITLIIVRLSIAFRGGSRFRLGKPVPRPGVMKIYTARAFKRELFHKPVN